MTRKAIWEPPKPDRSDWEGRLLYARQRIADKHSEYMGQQIRCFGAIARNFAGARNPSDSLMAKADAARRALDRVDVLIARRTADIRAGRD